MANIALPSTFRPETFSMALSTNQALFSSPFSGSEQVVDRLNDRWMVSLTIPRGASSTLASIEAFINAMRGMTNTCNLYHYERRQPRGTMRGAPLTNGVTKGASTVFIFTTPGATLLAGDMFGAAGLLFQVSTDCVADGAGNLVASVVNRVRRDLPALTPVIWDRPTTAFRMTSTSSVQYLPGYAEGVSLDFVEAVP